MYKHVYNLPNHDFSAEVAVVYETKKSKSFPPLSTLKVLQTRQSMEVERK